MLISTAIFSVMSCKKKVDPDQIAYENADGTIGARLYDHVLNETNLHTNNIYASKANFFRCKSCHGWDLLGREGALIGKAASPDYPEVADVNLYEWSRNHTPREVFDAVKNTGGRSGNTYDATMPDYGAIGLTDDQIWDIVKFLKEDSRNIYDFTDMTVTGTYPNGSITYTNIGKGGDPTAGLATYNSICKTCHGADGTAINVYCKPEGEFIGGMCRGDVPEVVHKAHFGMPYDYDHPNCQYAGEMPAELFKNLTDQDIRNILAMGQDTVAFPGD